MDHEQPKFHRLSDVVRAVLAGAGLGLIAIVSGAIWTARGQGVDLDWNELVTHAITGTSGGAVIGLVLYLTSNYRARGRIQHYCSWSLACAVAVFILASPGIPEDGWGFTLVFSLWLGFSAGLAFAFIARQHSGHRW